MEPTFNYPSPQDRHVFIKCEKDDPQACEFWCSNLGGWFSGDKSNPPHKGHDCGQIWRKRVDVPVGFKVVAEGDLKGTDLYYDAKDGTFMPCSDGFVNSTPQIVRHYYPDSFCIRPIKPAESQPVQNMHELKNNYYARQIKGVTIDVYDILAAYGVTNQATGHAIKKLLRNGNGHKDRLTDIQEAKQSLERAGELEGK